MGIKFSNNASSNITHALTADATSVSITPGTGDLFPSIVEGTDYFYATLAGNNGLEIVKVTRRVLDTMTIERAQDGTSALIFNQGDLFELRIVAADFEDTFSHVEATLEDTVSNLEATLEDTVSNLEATLEDTVDTLTTSVNNKMSSYLPLSGGTMEGIIRNKTSFDASVMPPSAAAYPADHTIVDKNGKELVKEQLVIRTDGSFAYRTSLINAEGNNINSHFDFERDGNNKASIKINTVPVLTSAGGTMTGVLYGSEGFIRGVSDAGNVWIGGGTNSQTSSYIQLNGGEMSSLPGGITFCPANSKGRGKALVLAYDSLRYDGNDVLTSAGGSLAGRLKFTKNPAHYIEVDANGDLLIGGDGSLFRVRGLNSDANPGGFQLRANDGTTSKYLIGYPDGTLTWGGKAILTSAGGNMDGELKFNPSAQNGINAVLVNRNDGYVQFCGSSAWANGAVCTLHGKSYTTKPGWVELRAIDGTNSASLVLKPDGSLLRSGNTVPSVVAWSSGYSWYRKWSDGWIEQGGLVGARSGRDTAVTFHLAFKNTNYTLTYGPSTGSAGNGANSDRVVWSSRTTTGFTFQRVDTSATYASWYACGY